jgi:hypothetical protein
MVQKLDGDVGLFSKKDMTGLEQVGGVDFALLQAGSSFASAQMEKRVGFPGQRSRKACFPCH